MKDFGLRRKRGGRKGMSFPIPLFKMKGFARLHSCVVFGKRFKQKKKEKVIIRGLLKSR